MKIQHIWCLVCLLGLMHCSDVSAQLKTIKFDAQDKYKSLAWMENLYDAGADMSGDSVILNEEALKLLNNDDYRNSVYPDIYTWSTTTRLMANQELKKAFWFLLNLYADKNNRDLVIKSILTYNSLFKMDQIMEATYKTYALFDPEIGSFENGKSRITAPHILDKKLNALKEILFLIDKYNFGDFE